MPSDRRYFDEALLIAQGKGRALAESAHVVAVVNRCLILEQRNNVLQRMLTALLMEQKRQGFVFTAESLLAVETSLTATNILPAEDGSITVILETPQEIQRRKR